MPPIDWGLLVNWIVSGLVGLTFGIIGGYATYRFQRIRDDIQWDREKAKLEQEWKHEVEKMETGWKQKLQELELQFVRQDQQRLRDMIQGGSEGPVVALRDIIAANEMFRERQMQRMQDVILRCAAMAARDDIPADVRYAIKEMLQEWTPSLPPSGTEGRELSAAGVGSSAK